MSAVPAGRVSRILPAALTVIACTSWLGCASEQLAGDQLHDDTARWTQGLRPRGEPGQKFGASAKAREIEENLGS